MGLRSRKRRMAGVADEDSFNVESSSYTMEDLNDHLANTQHNMDAFNGMWKRFITSLAYALVVFEIYSLWSIVRSSTVEHLAIVSCLKLTSMATILLIRNNIITGDDFPLCLGLSLLHAGFWFTLRIWTYDAATIKYSTPLCSIYFTCATAAMWLIGANTKAEMIRANNLKKLQATFEQ